MSCIPRARVKSKICRGAEAFQVRDASKGGRDGHPVFSGELTNRAKFSTEIVMQD